MVHGQEEFYSQGFSCGFGFRVGTRDWGETGPPKKKPSSLVVTSRDIFGTPPIPFIVVVVVIVIVVECYCFLLNIIDGDLERGGVHHPIKSSIFLR